MNRELTREEAIRLHREMWTDMQAELGDDPNTNDRLNFKEKWVEEHFPIEDVLAHCFLCEYASRTDRAKCTDNRCNACPIAWNSNDEPICNPGIWDFWERNAVDYRYSPISEILALPERKV